MPNIQKFKKGTGLIEAMLAILILAILVVGGSLHFAYGRGQIELRKHYRVAVHLASQKLEELKAGSYDDIAEGETKESLSLEDLSFSRIIETQDLGLYKQVQVTVYWERMGKGHDVSLVTNISPK